MCLPLHEVRPSKLRASDADEPISLRLLLAKCPPRSLGDLHAPELVANACRTGVRLVPQIHGAGVPLPALRPVVAPLQS